MRLRAGRVWRSRKAYEGQILPFAAAFLVLCCALFYFAANTGQLTVEKTRVTNAADAAAYSAGVVQARALNLTAYSNRAIIANQVAVAQALSLTNELNHITSTYTATDSSVVEELVTGGIWANIPIDGAGRERFATHAVLTAGSLVAQFYGYSPQQFVQYLIPYTNYVGAGLVSAASFASLLLETQQQMLWAAGEITVNQRSMVAGRSAAAAMDPAIKVDYIYGSTMEGAAPSMVRRYDDGDRERIQRVVLDALDPVILNRDEDAHSALLRSCFGARTGFERRGGTFMPDLDHWSVNDNQTYRYLSPRWYNPCRTRNSDEFEGARATVGGGMSEAGTGEYVSFVNNTESLDQYFQYARYNGMARVYDIKDNTDTSATQHRPGFSVYAHKPKTATKTSGHNEAMSPSGRLELFAAVNSTVTDLGALARAEILYDRPPRSDGKVEYPNLYNPFWTVRLVRPRAEDYVEYALK